MFKKTIYRKVYHANQDVFENYRTFNDDWVLMSPSEANEIPLKKFETIILHHSMESDNHGVYGMTIKE